MADTADAGTTLTALILCGFMGMAGQGIRAAVGLKQSNSLGVTKPDNQVAFSAAYFALSLMIGFIAGLVAGLVAGLKKFTNINLDDPKLLLGIAASGYAGADFIENSLSIVIPPSSTAPASQTPAQPAAAPLSASFMSASLPVPVPPPSPGVPANAIQAALTIVLPSVSATTWTPALTAGFAKYDLDNARRVAAAIGQFAVEAGAGFQELAENLNYTHAQHIHDVFPSEFPTVESAEPYVGNPEKLANRAYANRLGNGDEASGDGWRFRGRGLIQLTGRGEYEEFGSTIGKTAEEVSDYCGTPEGAAMSGCWYLSSRGCLSLADMWNLSAITKKVNGSAMLGNAQRIAYSNDFLKHIGGS